MTQAKRMNPTLRCVRLRWRAIATSLLVAVGTNASAQSYPSKTIRLIVPFSAGGGTDFFARVVATKLTQVLGQQVVVDNRAGAGGIIGTDLVAKAAPDGYTLLMGHTGTLAINPSLYANIPYDPVRDFSPVSLVAISPLVLVTNPSLPVETVKELIALAKRRPGDITFASGGSGTGTHLSAELFKIMAAIDMSHVPYKGTGPALTAGISGEVATLFSTLPPAVPHIRNGGRLRALAVTGSARAQVVPEIPTMAESGLPGYESTLRYGVLLPAGARCDSHRSASGDFAVHESTRLLRSDGARWRRTAGEHAGRVSHGNRDGGKEMGSGSEGVRRARSIIVIASVERAIVVRKCSRHANIISMPWRSGDVRR